VRVEEVEDKLYEYLEDTTSQGTAYNVFKGMSGGRQESQSLGSVNFPNAQSYSNHQSKFGHSVIGKNSSLLLKRQITSPSLMEQDTNYFKNDLNTTVEIQSKDEMPEVEEYKVARPVTSKLKAKTAI